MSFRHLPVTSLTDVTANFEQLQAHPRWIPLALLHSWKNVGAGAETAACTINALGEVRLKGIIEGGESNKSAFLLPLGYRPGATAWYGLLGGSFSRAILAITAEGEGEIAYEGAEKVFTIAGVTFIAEN